MVRIVIEKNVAIFMDLIAFAEGTYGKGDDGYNIMFGGNTFDSYAEHPRIKNTIRELTSDAAGRYQLLGRYYLPYTFHLEVRI